MKKIVRSVAIGIIALILLVWGRDALFFNSPQLFHGEKEFHREKEQFSGALEAMQYMNAQRIYPKDKLPSSGYTGGYHKKIQLKRQKSKRKAYRSSSEWEAMGPHNIGGRTLFIEINPGNPKTLYAGAATGGLWRSYSAGEGEQA